MRPRLLLTLLLVVSLVAVFYGTAQDTESKFVATSRLIPSQYDPTDAGEPLPPQYRQLLRRDAIAPVYDPTFIEASQAGWDDDTLVLGVDIDGEARAYPIGFLNRREIVVDMHRGIPTLVTW